MEEDFINKDARIKELEDALAAIMDGTDWQTIQKITGISTDKCIKINKLADAILYPTQELG